MPWQSSRLFRMVEGVHYRARCSECASDSEVCTKRMAKGEDAEDFAVRVLLKSGWHADGLAGGRRSADGARWLCPKCAKAERRS
jgi:hypothetical protein